MLSMEYVLKLLIITGVLNLAWLSVPEKVCFSYEY
jgi:hypothetical protein